MELENIVVVCFCYGRHTVTNFKRRSDGLSVHDEAGRVLLARRQSDVRWKRTAVASNGSPLKKSPWGEERSFVMSQLVTYSLSLLYVMC